MGVVLIVVNLVVLEVSIITGVVLLVINIYLKYDDHLVVSHLRNLLLTWYQK
jgi:hypothetical protein